MQAAKAAASVAAQLLAFYREPALRRPPYLHGETPMPDGQVVLRLALGRIPQAWLADLDPRDRAEAGEAARAFVRQVCLWERATHYQVLCLGPEARREAIRECYHLLIALIHPDRQGAADSGWPNDCAQRANQAHAVLGDPAERARYDEQLDRAADGMSLEASARRAQASEAPGRPRKRRSAPVAIARGFMLVTGVVAALFVVQAWWVGGAAPQYSLLESAMPTSARWVREVLPDPPRFLGVAAGHFDVEALEPLREPKRIAAVGTWIPMQKPAPEPVAAPVAVVATAGESRPAPAIAVSRPVEPTLRLAQGTSLAVARPAPQRLAQAQPQAQPAQPQGTRPAAAAPASPSRDQVEGLVALLVSYYDAGDADRLVDLYDPGRLGFWSGMRTRNAYADFFGATRERRLRMERLTWQANGASAQARGEATVVADFLDGRPRIERRVPVEIDIGLRDGQARITRLLLFPSEQ